MLSTAPALSPAPAASRRPQLRLVPPPRPRPPHSARALVAYAAGLAIGLVGVAVAHVISGTDGALLYGALGGMSAVVAVGGLVRTRHYARYTREIRS